MARSRNPSIVSSAGVLSSFAASIPEVRDGNELEVHLLCMLQEGWNQSAFHAVSTADNAYPDTVVGAENGAVA